jgi:pimeloyl-ACP methyl ester carboxylesterase
MPHRQVRKQAATVARWALQRSRYMSRTRFRWSSPKSSRRSRQSQGTDPVKHAVRVGLGRPRALQFSGIVVSSMRVHRNRNSVARGLAYACCLAVALPTIHGKGAWAQPQPTPGTPDAALLAEAKGRWATLGFATRMVQVNGVTLHVAEAGRGDPVLLLHGYPQSGEAWRSVAPELAKAHRVIIPDLRGMGLSEAAKDGYDLNNVAEDIHQLVLSMGIAKIKVVGHDWGAAIGAVYALRYRNEVTHLAFLESALAGAGFETLWNFSRRNDAFTFVPFLLMGEGDSSGDTTAALIQGRESIFLHHLWATFTGDKGAAPFAGWAPFVAAMARPGIAAASSTYYRAVYHSAEQVRKLVTHKLEIPVLAIAGEKGIGANHIGLVRAFARNVRGNFILPGSGHFLPEERPNEVVAALEKFLAD